LLNPENLPLEPVLNEKGQPLVCSVEIEFSDVYFQAWRVNVGRASSIYWMPIVPKMPSIIAIDAPCLWRR